jgi:hypothetical protein
MREYTVGDLLMWRDAKFGHDRVWKVEAILLGAEGVDGMVRLRPIFDAPMAQDENGNRPETLLVPECLLRSLEWFAHRPHATVQ